MESSRRWLRPADTLPVVRLQGRGTCGHRSPCTSSWLAAQCQWRHRRRPQTWLEMENFRNRSGGHGGLSMHPQILNISQILRTFLGYCIITTVWQCRNKLFVNTLFRQFPMISRCMNFADAVRSARKIFLTDQITQLHEKKFWKPAVFW